MRNRESNRGFVRVLIAGAFMSLTNAAFAQQDTTLFKIITVKDEIVVALSSRDRNTLGGDDVTHIGRAIKADGELTVWQYVVRKGPDGDLEQAPLKRVSLIGHESLRVEPYTSPLRVVPLPGD